MIDPKTASEVPQTIDRSAIVYILSEKFTYHKFLSPKLKKLLINMLNPVVESRYTIFQVLDSEWVIEKGEEYGINVNDYRYDAIEKQKQKIAEEKARHQKIKELTKRESMNNTGDNRALFSKQDNDFTLGDANVPIERFRVDENHKETDNRDFPGPPFLRKNSNQIRTNPNDIVEKDPHRVIELLNKANQGDGFYKNKNLNDNCPKPRVENGKKFDQVNKSPTSEKDIPKPKGFFSELSHYLGCGLD